MRAAGGELLPAAAVGGELLDGVAAGGELLEASGGELFVSAFALPLAAAGAVALGAPPQSSSTAAGLAEAPQSSSTPQSSSGGGGFELGLAVGGMLKIASSRWVPPAGGWEPEAAAGLVDGLFPPARFDEL